MYDSALLAELAAASTQKASAGKVKRHTNQVWDAPGLTIESWKFNEWDYYSTKVKLPIPSRGLFTKEDQIVVRGYDKFFNVGEVESTKWNSILTETTGPYALTLKENGCKIMIGGYNGKLIVTSKNRTGPQENDYKNHSLAATNWIKARLKEAGKTEQELASELEEKDLTAVGEFCDDNFEEHVLAYPPESAGIYLNGLNRNTREFQTLAPNVVNELGARYGFLRTDFLMVEGVDETKQFLEKCAETGAYNGRDIEGFVVRCKKDGKDFFFKYKFKEPYLMYREWRTATHVILKDPQAAWKSKMHKEATNEFLKFARPYLKSHPELAEKIQKEGKGIIELREKFLEYSNLDPEQLLQLQINEKGTDKYVLIPVATIGCGKTTVALTLASLYGWGHVQNDDVSSKSGKFRTFSNRISQAFSEHDVVIVDRNNHQFRERQQLFEAMDLMADANGYDMHYIGLDFLPNGPAQKEWEVTLSRVMNRGDNHQTIRNMDRPAVEAIMKGFRGRYQPITVAKEPDSNFELVIDVNCARGSKDNVTAVVSALNDAYDMDLETKPEELNAAFSAALEHKAKIPVGTQPAQKRATWSFFCIRVDSKEMMQLLASNLQGNPFWQELQVSKGMSLKQEFHVTLAHKASEKTQFKALKTKYHKLLTGSKENGFVDLNVEEPVIVESICWNTRIMAAAVSLPGEHCSSNFHPHITVGMAKGVPPKEANAMMNNYDNRVEIKPVRLTGRLCAFR
ncbi:tRNA ligase [Wickerhamiella sorbophila]|uniref:tRNA ligase n=1 Tax=Wickerhamiella sorbophila TaxID=45607 RepID=A0A2T0FGL5_9ASCO|nr:tRNA ligase [Wickerhamiella sorbophila]PRT54107.1 tRNA ligase [Wickerhamiella sorbophila]